MPKRKHSKKQAVIPCTDANQRTKESIKERARVTEAMTRRYEKLREEYMEEMKRREEAEKMKPKILNPSIKPTGDVANQ